MWTAPTVTDNVTVKFRSKSSRERSPKKPGEGSVACTTEMPILRRSRNARSSLSLQAGKASGRATLLCSTPDVMRFSKVSQSDAGLIKCYMFLYIIVCTLSTNQKICVVVLIRKLFFDVSNSDIRQRSVALLFFKEVHWAQTASVGIQVLPMLLWYLEPYSMASLIAHL